METKLTPARATPPGRILRRELEARGWTQQDLAGILGRPTQAITEIIRGSKQITPETAVALGAAFGMSAEFWANLESNYRLALARQGTASSDEVSRKAKLYELVPVGELIKRGWIKASKNIDELEAAVFDFLGIGSINEAPKLIVNLRHSARDGSQDAAQRAWVRRVEVLARARQVGRFDRKKLETAISSLRALALEESGVAKVPALLEKLGIRFVVVPHLTRTKLDGAAAYVEGGPVVALTMRYDRIDYFWFTLFHELAHIVLDHQGGHLDEAPDDGEISEEEQEANDRAGAWLVSDADVKALCRRRPSRAAIEEFAAKHALHPGIVVGRLHGLNLVPYSYFRPMLVKVRDQLGPWMVDAPE